MRVVCNNAWKLFRRQQHCTFSSVPLPPLGLLKLREKLDDAIVGHHDLKEAVILALLSCEHVYVEGPPGTAKTRLAETAAKSVGLSTFVYQLHRDTRLHEILGDSVIVKEHEAGGGEIIRQSVRPGGILTSQLAVLDDVSRAPGEALNVLLRILNERRFCTREGDIEIPLVTAIATGNPCNGAQDYYAEPLDPAVLDRFTLHVKTQGLIEGESWDEALRVMAMNSGHNKDTVRVLPHEGTDISATLQAAHRALPTVVFAPELQKLLLEVLKRLSHEITALKSSQSAATSSSGGLFTDRTFLAKGPLICRAHAMLQGRSACNEDDIYAIRYLTPFRLPEQVHARMDEIIEDVINTAKEKQNASREERGGSGKGGDLDARGPAEDSSKDCNDKPIYKDNNMSESQSSVFGESEQSQPQTVVQHEESEDGVFNDKTRQQQEQPLQQVRNHVSDSILVPVLQTLAHVESFFRRLTGLEFKYPQHDVVPEKLVSQGHVEPLLAAIGGRIRKKAREKRKVVTIGGSGQPRGWGTPHSVKEISCGDLDEASMAGWAQEPTPHLPRVIARQVGTRPRGRLAIMRDVSASMEGAHSVWASAVVSSLLQMCQKRSISVGYLEFNHEPTPIRGGKRASKIGDFFSREYETVLGCARGVQNMGGTNIQFALRTVINEYASVPSTINDCSILQKLGRELFLGRIQGGQVWASTRSQTKLSDYGIYLPSEMGARRQRRSLPQESHHILLVTDGVPTFGCLSCTEEREEARAMGLCVHTVFIGDSDEYPGVLGSLAKATGGVSFQAMIDYQTGRVKLLNHEALA